MNRFKFILILSVILGFLSINYGYTLESKCVPGGKFSLSDPSAVANKANQKSSINPDGAMDPFVSGALSGYYNMMQGATGNAYNAQEVQKQQADYAKQQMENPKNQRED